jgi:hexulose-6-phosphate isomerase
MATLFTRRDLFSRIGGLAALPILSKISKEDQEQPFHKTLSTGGGPRFKACKLSMVREGKSLEDKFRLLRDLGFDATELDSPNHFLVSEVLSAKKATGIRIHGTIDSVHWRHTLSDPRPEIRAKGLKALRTGLQDAHDYGATTCLLVPGVVRKEIPYDLVYERSQKEIKKALPLAEKLGVKIAIENVWNGFLQSPLEFRNYIDEFQSPWIGAYLDIGNMRKFGWPTHWIRILGKRILKVDIKGWSFKKGFGVGILEGNIDWKACMEELSKVGYEDVITAEVSGGKKGRLAAIAKDLDKILSFSKKSD